MMSKRARRNPKRLAKQLDPVISGLCPACLNNHRGKRCSKTMISVYDQKRIK